MAAYVVLLTLAFILPLARLMVHAAGSDLHSHILLVPLISVYLLVSRRAALPASGPRSVAGAVLLGTLGLVALGAGIWWRESVSPNDGLALMAVAYVSLLAAGGFLFRGSKWMAAAAFPFAFLVFMVPLPDGAVNWLERASAAASAEAAALYFAAAGPPSCETARCSSCPASSWRWPRSAAGSGPAGCSSSRASSRPTCSSRAPGGGWCWSHS